MFPKKFFLFDEIILTNVCFYGISNGRNSNFLYKFLFCYHFVFPIKTWLTYEIVWSTTLYFYNQRGKQEREFDILKNDFIWNKMPFSKLEQNTVFLITTAICRNIYNHIISTFSKRYKNLSPEYRIKKFIFRFICIPAKWIKSSRLWKLRVYGEIGHIT